MRTQIILIAAILIGFQSCGQNKKISKEITERYYSSNVKVGEINQGLFDSLQLVNKEHPARFYEICGAYVQDSMMNEAAIAYFIGSNRFRLYNKTNPNYEASGDGALAGSFAYIFGDALNDHLNENLDNYSALLHKTGEWYSANKHYYFENSMNDSLYNLQIKGFVDFSDELKNNPEKYIKEKETQRKEMEKMLLQMKELAAEANNQKEEIKEEKKIKKPTSEFPEAFFTNFKLDHFIVGQQNEISAVAHGWFDTYLECENGDIIQSEINSLHYIVVPKEIGVCVLKLYGVREDGFKGSLPQSV